MSRALVAGRVAVPVLVAGAALAACGRDDPASAVPRTLTPNPASLWLFPGASTVVRVTANGGSADRMRVTWESSAPDVVAVVPTAAGASTATFTGLRSGSAAVRVSARIGHAWADSTIPVVVTTAPCPLAGPSMTPQTSPLLPGETVRLRITPPACGRAAGDTLATWLSLDTLVAVVDSTGLVTARASGVATIRATLLPMPPRLAAVATITVRRTP